MSYFRLAGSHDSPLPTLCVGSYLPIVGPQVHNRDHVPLHMPALSTQYSVIIYILEYYGFLHVEFYHGMDSYNYYSSKFVDSMIYDALPEWRNKLGGGAQLEHYELSRWVSLGLSASYIAS